jgi:hypothetical protein
MDNYALSVGGKCNKLRIVLEQVGARGSVVVKALSYNPGGRGFETRWGEWISSIYLILPVALDPGDYSTSKRNELESRARPVRKADNLTAICEPIV